MSLFPVRDLFPFAEFDSKAKGLVLHFYIAHQNDASAEGRIKKLGSDQKLKELLDFQDPIYQLAPLALAVMHRDIQKVTNLVALGVKLDPRDVHGCTPLHYAALQQDATIIALLQAAGKTQGIALDLIVNHAGQTPQALFERTLATQSEDGEVVFLHKKETAIVEGTAKEFRELTGASFVQRSLITPAGMVKEWVRTAKEKTALAVIEQGRKPLQNLEANRPRLFISQTGKDTGLGLFTDMDLPQGAWLTTYNGKIGEFNNADDPDYLLEPVDGKLFRNLGPMANDSFPNCCFESIFYIDGLFQMTILKTIRPVKRGEQLTVHYGTEHGVKKNHRELKCDEMEAYFRSGKRKTLMEIVTNGILNNNSEEKEIGEYLSSTSSSVFHLYLKGVVDWKDLCHFWSFLVELLPGDQSSLVRIVQSFFKQYDINQSLKDALTQFNLENSIVATTFVLRYLGKTAKEQTLISCEELQSVSSKIAKIADCFDQICTLKKVGEWEPNREYFHNFLVAVEDFPSEGQSFWLELIKTSMKHQNHWAKALSTWVELAWKDQELKQAFLKAD